MKRQIKNQANAGFTLVEVMVCVFVIAVFCIPLFRGFNLSALNNSRAHHTQMATTYAQKKLELLMAARLDTNDRGGADGALDELMAQFDDLLFDSSGNASVLVADHTDAAVTTLREAVKDDYDGDPIYDKAKFDHLFTPIVYTQENVEVGGRRYNMEVVIDPTPYSRDKASYIAATGVDDVYYEDADSEVEAYNNNVIRRAPIDNIGPEFATIDGTYTNPPGETNVASGPLKALFDQAVIAGAAAAADEDTAKQDIYKNMRKEIFVDITPTTPTTGVADSITVKCVVKYSVTYNGAYCEWTSPTTYFGDFPLVRSSDGQSWDSGGRVYIFAKALRISEAGYNVALGETDIQTSTNPTGGNIITITNTVSSANSGGYPLDIYLVREYYQTATGAFLLSDNFRTVTVRGTTGVENYYTVPALSTPPLLTGAATITVSETGGNIVTNLRTNIKGKIDTTPPLLSLGEADAKATVVGEEEPRLRNYRITVTLTNPSDGRVMAQVASTKRVI